MKNDSRRDNTLTAGIKAGWLSILVGCSLCLLVAALWWTFDRHEQANLSGKLQAEADFLVSRVDADLRNRIPSLKRMALRWEFRGGTPKDEFINDAQAYFSDTPGFQALEWVDEDFIVRWVVPLKGNDRAVNLNLASEPKRRIALERAKATGSPTMTAPIDLVQGGKGFLVYFPINTQGEFDGFILATFRIQEWLTYVFDIRENLGGSADYRMLVSIDGTLVYKQDGWDGLARTGPDADASTDIMGHRFSINIRPTTVFTERSKTLLPTFTAGFGLLLSLLVAAVVYLYRKASMETAAARAAQTAMESEERNLKAIFESSPVGMIVLDEHTNIIMANEAAKGISAENSTDMLERQPGDVMKCIHSSEDPRGCGHSQHCPLCPLRNAIESVISGGTSLRNIELAVDVVRQGMQETIWLALGAEPFLINDRRLVVVALHEITGRKLAEEALKLSEEQVRLLLNSTGEAIYGIDLEGRCTFANPACLRMLGYASVEQLLGKNMHQLIHHSYPDGHQMPVERCRIYQAFHEGRPEHAEDEVLWGADGTSFPVEYWSYPQIINGATCGAVVTFVDITERKQVEDALHQRELYLTAIIENQPGLVWLKNTDSQFLAVNQAFAVSCGKQRPEELVGKTDLDIWPLELAEQYRRDDFLTMKTGKPTIVEEPINDKGETRWFETFKAPVFDGEGNIIGTTGYARDITGRKQMEEERKQQFSLINCLLDSIPDIIFFKDLNGVYLGCNPPFREFVGRSREEIIGRTDYDLFGKEVADSFREHDQIMLESRNSRHNEEWITYPDGREKLLDTLKTPYLGPDGELIGVVGISRDITVQRLAQEALVIERRRLASILEGTNVGTWEWNVQTGETIFNERWAEILGYTLAELAPLSIDTWVKFAHPDDIKVSNVLLEKHFNKELPYYETESRMRHKNGSWIWVLDRGKVAAWTEDGRPLMVSGTHQDITKRKRAEEQLEQLNRTLQQRIDDTVAELREKDQVLIHQGRLAAMGEMIGNIAHQWRQPLNALSMLITNLHFAHRDNELTGAYMNESVTSANRLIQKMSTTINDFRNFFSPDKEMVSFSANQQIKQAVQLVDAAFKNSNIEIVIDETTDCILKGFPNEYSQVLLNLFTNAREAIMESGSLPGLIRINIMEHGGMGVVTVRDNGGGIPELILGRIFEPYFTTKSKGTGVGLYMSKMIIERNMNGLIEACNVSGGSEFSVSIPLAEKTS